MVIRIKWNKKAVIQMDQAIKYIWEDSVVNAEIVQRNIILAIDALQKHPEKYPPDKYKIENDGSYRHSKYITTEYPTGIKFQK